MLSSYVKLGFFDFMWLGVVACIPLHTAYLKKKREFDMESEARLFKYVQMFFVLRLILCIFIAMHDPHSSF